MNKSNDINPFDENAEHYDVWFDTQRGRSVFESETLCLRPLASGVFRPWLEVGVGTGRFAQALGVEHGIDPETSSG